MDIICDILDEIKSCQKIEDVLNERESKISYILEDFKYVFKIGTHTVNQFLDDKEIDCFSIGDFKNNAASILEFLEFCKDEFSKLFGC